MAVLSISNEKLISALSGKRVGIIGDVMLDKYILGRVERMSPEAPVPVLVHDRSVERLGGAANVALNVHELKSIPFVCSVIGADQAGDQLVQLMRKAGDEGQYLIRSDERKTTTKTRLLGNNQHLLRLDAETQDDLSVKDETRLIETIDAMLEKEVLDAVILQDYNKGVMTEKVIRHAIDACKSKNIFVAVDPKFNRFFSYHGADLFKPNLKEISEALGYRIDASQSDLDKAETELRQRLGHGKTMVTLSADGIYINEGSEGSHIVPTQPSEVNDVCGAGDAVMAVATILFQDNMGAIDVGLVCNKAGRIVCQKIGVAPVHLAEIIRQEQ